MTIHSLHGGGAERVFRRLAIRWAELGHEIHIITWSTADSDPQPLPLTITRHGLGVLQAKRPIWQALGAHRRRVGKLRQCLRRLQPQIVLSFCDQMNISTLQAARGLGLPVWIAERSDPAHQRLSPWWEHRRRRNYPTCSGCIVQTEQIAEHLSQLIPRQRIVIIPNAVSELPSSAEQPTTEVTVDVSDQSDASVPLGAPAVVLYVGRLAPEKGVDLLLRAWRIAQPQLDAWQLHIAGDGSLREQLEQQSADLPSVHFLGWLSNPAAAYAASQVFVLPSRYEGFPNALLEAMAHGLACIATRCTQAVDELAQQGRAVLTIPPAASRIEEQAMQEALAQALIELATSPPRRRELGEAARWVTAAYSWDQIGPQWDRILTAQAEPAVPRFESGSPPTDQIDDVG